MQRQWCTAALTLCGPEAISQPAEVAAGAESRVHRRSSLLRSWEGEGRGEEGQGGKERGTREGGRMRGGEGEEGEEKLASLN